MSAMDNVVKQATGLVEALVQAQENYAKLVHVNDGLVTRLKEADANLNAKEGECIGFRITITNLTDRLEEEIRKNEKLRLGLSQFVNLMEQAQPVNEAPKPIEEKKNYVNNTATKPPFYGVHTENGETIIYPPEQCQTQHQLSQFYRLAGLIISHDKLMERRGIHSRGLQPRHKERLKSHYQLKFPDGPKEPERPFVKDLAPHYINSGQSATHGLPEEPGRFR